jgi:hypothetical protein
VLNAAELSIGLTYGWTARDRAWESEPFYVHEIIADEYPEAERRRLAEVIENLLTDASPSKCWKTLFPTIKVSVTGAGKASPYSLVAGKCTKKPYQVSRQYLLPKDAALLQGTEVLFELRYVSVVPRSLSVFRLFSPWMTYGLEAFITVHDDVRFVGRGQRSFRTQKISVETESVGRSGTVTVRTDDLLLPGLIAEIRWQRVALEQGRP